MLEVEKLLEKGEKIWIINYYKRKYPKAGQPRVMLVAATNIGWFLLHGFYDDRDPAMWRCGQLDLGFRHLGRLHLADYKNVEKVEFLAYTL